MNRSCAPNTLFSVQNYVMEPIDEETKIERLAEPTPKMEDFHLNDDLMLDYGDSLINLSNLVCRKTKLAPSLKQSFQKKPPQKPRPARPAAKRMYPSLREASQLDELTASEVLSKCRIHRQKEAPPSTRYHQRPAWDESPQYGCLSPRRTCDYTPAPPTTPRKPSSEPLQIEVSPGFYSPLRGSNETWDAISRGHITRVDCFSCATPLVCIADAEYVLCPDCRVVSPTCVADCMLDRKLPAKPSGLPHAPLVTGGVGLGMKANEL